MLKHLALIMDGNRRWAKENNLFPWQGHYHGIKAVEHSIEFCIEKGIKFLSLYTFSLENFKRNITEKNYLFDLIIKFGEIFLPKLLKYKVKIKFIGDKSLFPESIVDTILYLEEQTKEFEKLTVNMLFCYGGRQEIVDAINKIVKETNKNLIKPAIKLEDINSYLWCGKMPDPDLIIRTGGQKRLSNFLLFQAAYSELYFTDTYWPSFNKEHLELAIQEYNHRKRNYGK